MLLPSPLGLGLVNGSRIWAYITFKPGIIRAISTLVPNARRGVIYRNLEMLYLLALSLV